VWLTDEPEFLEPREDVPERGGRDPETLAGKPQRGDRLAVVDVGLHEHGKNPPISFVKLRMTIH
jgi:hypothetical protein